MTITILLIVACASAVIIMVAALLMLRVSDLDEAVAIRFEAAHGRWTAAPDLAKPKSAAGLAMVGQRAVLVLGRAAMQSGLLPGRTRSELLSTLSAAGFRNQTALPLFVGSKLAMLFGLPVAAFLLSRNSDLGGMTQTAAVMGSAVMGLIAPDMIIQRMRLAQLKKIERGLSDALDLMVICAQAGLSLEPAMARVAVELRMTHPELCDEFVTTVRELEMMSDSSQALTNLGERTGLESLRRLTATLTQTMQYGTPLTEALRTLSNEMRTATLTAFEERAARLPVLLTMPMILFILPTVFMIVGGPAGIQLSRSFSH